MYHAYSNNKTNANAVTVRSDGRLAPRRLALRAPMFVAVLVALTAPRPAASQDDPISVANAPSRPGSVRTEDDGPTQQQVARDEAQLAGRYKRLEEMFLRLAELSGATDPGQAELLRKAMVESKQRLIAVQFEQIVERLERDRLGDAVAAQKRLRTDLKALLELLLSDVRADRLNEEQQRVSAWLKQLDELISRQQSLRGRTERADDTRQLADDQGRLADQTGELGESMAEQEREASKPDDTEPADGKSSKDSPSGKPSDETKDANAESTERDDADSSDSSDSSESGESSSPSETEKSPEGESGGSSKSEDSNDPSQQSQQQGGSASGSGQQSSEPSPSEQRVSEARRRMRQAREQLEQAQRDNAVKEQNEALHQLEQAKAELEETLRQLREEEIAQMLAMLEARFRHMLQEQGEIYEATVLLDEKPKEQRGAGDQVQAVRLSERESQLAGAAASVLQTLRDDGSATAMPEAVEQVHDDMRQVAELISRYDIGTFTQSVEQDIISSLEELLAAVKQAQDDQEQRQQEGQQGQNGGQPAEPPLVDKLAELRMIRSLQQRINRRTLRLNQRSAQPDTPPDAIDAALDELSERQQRVIRATQAIGEGADQ